MKTREPNVDVSAVSEELMSMCCFEGIWVRGGVYMLEVINYLYWS